MTASNCTPGLLRSQYSSAHSDSNRIIGRPSRSVALRVPAVDADIAAILSAGPTTHRAALYGNESTSHATLYSFSQPRLQHFQLQRANRAEDRLAAPDRRIQHLHQALFLELADAIVELLEAHVAQTGDAEVFRREARDGRVLERDAVSTACRRCRTGRG